jgi:hypothetical protein
MPDYLKISELPAASSVAPTDQIELNQAGTSRSATVSLTVGVYQTVMTQTGAAATGTTVIPFDDTIPQITEGNEYMTLAITPKSATSRLVITVSVFIASTAAANTGLIMALFQDASANALTAASAVNTATNSPVQLTLTHTMTSGTTSATTFRVRAGCNAAGTTTFNGSGGARILGGAYASSIVIQEVA